MTEADLTGSSRSQRRPRDLFEVADRLWTAARCVAVGQLIAALDEPPSLWSNPDEGGGPAAAGHRRLLSRAEERKTDQPKLVSTRPVSRARSY